MNSGSIDRMSSAEELGRLAVSLPNWRWMPGMNIPGHGRIIVSWYKDKEGDKWPDLDDPATAGCLLKMLGEVVSVMQSKDKSWWVTSPRHNGWKGESATLGRACVLAAHAIGKWEEQSHADLPAQMQEVSTSLRKADSDVASKHHSDVSEVSEQRNDPSNQQNELHAERKRLGERRVRKSRVKAAQLGLFASRASSNDESNTRLDWSSIEYTPARIMVEKFHYSKKMPRGRNICYGWKHSHDLYAAAVYGNGVNPYQAKYLSKITGIEITNATYVELKRLVRVEPRLEDVYLSQLMNLCHRDLARLGYRCVIAFSDPDEGHEGTIYKAANFTHMGKTQAEWHCIDRDGNKVHRRVAYRVAKAKNIPIEWARENLGLTRVKTTPRDRWIWFISKSDRRRFHRHLKKERES